MSRSKEKKQKGLVKRLTINIPEDEWNKVEKLSEKYPKKGYIGIILDGINLLFEKEIQGGEIT